MSVLSFHNVSRVYGDGPARVEALSRICLTIEPGQSVALVGASGSGKTTLLNLAAGLDRPSEGTVRLGEDGLSGMDEAALARMRSKRIGFLFQSVNLIPTLSAAENMVLRLELAGAPRADQAGRVASLLESAALADKANAYPDELSAGQQQRVAALRAVVHRPPLVLMDEPTSCLDAANADRLMELLGELSRAEGTAMILATHDMNVSRRMGRVVHLHDGRVVDAERSTDN